MTTTDDEYLADVEYRVTALCAKPRSGREIAEAWRKKLGFRIGDGTLYTTLQRLRDRGLVAQEAGRDDRTRLYSLTPAGKSALRATARHHRGLARFLPARLGA